MIIFYKNSKPSISRIIYVKILNTAMILITMYFYIVPEFVLVVMKAFLLHFQPTERHRNKILIVCAIRVVFIPLIFFCNIKPRVYTETIFDNDFCPLVFILTLGLTNGYFSTLCMMYGPK